MVVKSQVTVKHANWSIFTYSVHVYIYQFVVDETLETPSQVKRQKIKDTYTYLF